MDFTLNYVIQKFFRKIEQFKKRNKINQMSQSKPIQGRPLIVELIYEMNKFMPLNGLIKCAQSNYTLKELTIPRARKVHSKLISLYFADISTLAIWFKQLALQMAEVRVKIHRQTSIRMTPELLVQLSLDLLQLRNLMYQFLDKTNKIIAAEEADQAGNILDRFNLPLTFQNELRQIRANHIEKAFAPAEFELSQWQPENIPSWNEMIDHFRGILSTSNEEDMFELLNDSLHEYFSKITDHAKVCEDQLKNLARVIHMNRPL